LILLEPISPKPQPAASKRPQSGTPGEKPVASLLAIFALLAAFYGICVAAGVLPFNSGAWVVGEGVAARGWLAYVLSAIVHFTAGAGLWRHRRWAHWLAVFLLAIGLLPAVPGISSAVVDLRIAGIALWGTLIVLRTAALYLLVSAD
jgi:hypothetical protein